MSRTVRWLRVHGHHIVFSLSLASLAALAGWWAVYFGSAVARERTLRLESLEAAVRMHAFVLGAGEAEPRYGPLPADERLEITGTAEAAAGLSSALVPRWPALSVQPRTEVIAAWDASGRRRLTMVAGESVLLVVLLFVSCLMLYRLVRAERRAHTEVTELWERATHEMKTPIAGLKAFLQTLGRGALPPEELGRYVDMAMRQVNRQERLADNLLLGQQIGRTRPDLQRVELRDFLDRFLHDHALNLVGRRVHVKSAANLAVEADPGALDAILASLADNAARYGGEDVEVDISAVARGRRVEIAVTDDGPGFDPRRAEELFEAYKRLEPRQGPVPRSGTGLGLYIARRLARRMGGDLTAHSGGPGHGATFCLEMRRMPV